MLVFLSLYVTLSILLSILVCAAASLLCVCLVSVQVSAPYGIAGSTQVLYTFLFRQMATLLLKMYPSVWRVTPSLPWFFIVSFVLVLSLEAVVLSQVYVAFNIFCHHIVHVYWVVYITTSVGTIHRCIAILVTRFVS